jgi:periplasmic divalent cation tolerance protein
MPAEGNNLGEREVTEVGKADFQEAIMTYVIAYITTRDHDEASRIGETLVREKLAACANIIHSIDSVYWWKGSIEEEKESLLIIKTKKSLVPGLIKRVKELHSYEAPCVDIIPVTDGNKDYFKWVEDVTK